MRAGTAPGFLAVLLGAGAVGLTVTAAALAPENPRTSGLQMAALLVVLVVAGTLQVQLRYGLSQNLGALRLLEGRLTPEYMR